MFRDRTNLFLSYRRTFPHSYKRSTERNRSQFGKFYDVDKSKTDLDATDEELLLRDVESDPFRDVEEERPTFFEITNEVDQHLADIASNMRQLSRLYKRNALPGFGDKSGDEKEIEDLSYEVTRLFQRCYNIIKKVEVIYEQQTYKDIQLQHDELIILDNLKKKYAGSIQVESNKFRVLQNNYLKYLNKDDLKPIIPRSIQNSSSAMLQMDDEEEQVENSNDIEAYSRNALIQQQDQDMSQQFLRERDEEIKKLAKGVLEVSTIFREMQSLIIDQGTIVDRIDYNLENTVVQLKSAEKELETATHHQKRTQKCKVILLLVLAVVALFLFVMMKPHGGSKTYVSSPTTIIIQTTTSNSRLALVTVTASIEVTSLGGPLSNTQNYNSNTFFKGNKDNVIATPIYEL